MNLALAYDTETTGLPLFSEPSEDPRQPHIVQLAAALVDLDTRKTVSSIDVIIRPDGWGIPSDVSEVHGITTEIAMDLGIPEKDALAMFMALWDGRTRIAHNESFDARIIRIAQHRFGYADEVMESWKSGKAECTARLSTPIVKCPPTAKMRAAGRNHFKTPNLAEAYRHFTGQELQNTHNAMADVQGCLAVYFALQDPVKAELST
ncbi:3'-5' exonuclease [Corticimicrobacter populi]|uniref:3'-5' exonuclease n=1 Tax=Corticimicrobacter populi TaxID=2175229 RepID=A0A2V1K6A5_9BURK|nr:3'-5' exonuclease [Corticimicrobacter populi]PWF25015.1 3'-5' exonuclease [Corticimicrobacter populi]